MGTKIWMDIYNKLTDLKRSAMITSNHPQSYLWNILFCLVRGWHYCWGENTIKTIETQIVSNPSTLENHIIMIDIRISWSWFLFFKIKNLICTILYFVRNYFIRCYFHCFLFCSQGLKLQLHSNTKPAFEKGELTQSMEESMIITTNIRCCRTYRKLIIRIWMGWVGDLVLRKVGRLENFLNISKQRRLFGALEQFTKCL